MNHLSEFLQNADSLQAFRIFNLIIAVFGAAMIFSMKTEAVNEERPWTTHLALAFVIFALQYIAYHAGIRLYTATLFDGSNALVWAELFGIPINWFFMSAAWTLLNKQRRLPRWFPALLALDLIAVAVAVFYLRVDSAVTVPETLCRFVGDAISFVSLTCLGYALYINTQFYKSRSGMGLGVVIGLCYGGIHLISPFLPNISAWYERPDWKRVEIERHLTVIFTFVAALYKLALLYSAFLIRSLETQTLIKLRNKLRESVFKRIVFFSDKGFLEATSEAFRVDRVKLYIRVPPVKEAAEERRVHRYWRPSKSPSKYRTLRENQTPLPRALDRLFREEEAGRGDVTLRERISRALGGSVSRETFDGIEPIRYHGGLIGCLKIKNKGVGKFTYSAKHLCRIFCADIAPVVQSYRLQESLRVLTEGLNQNLGTPPKGSSFSSAALSGRFEKVIHEVLSPVRTAFVLDAGFVKVKRRDEEGEAAEGLKPRTYNCVTDEASGRLRIGRLRLEYQKERDPLDSPSLGYFRVYGEAVASIAANTFSASIDEWFDRIIRNLSFELTKTQTIDSWFQEVRARLKDAELEGSVLYHPELAGSRPVVRSNEAEENRAVAEALARALPDPREFLRKLNDSRPRLVSSAPGRLVLGMKLPHVDAGLFVGVSRTEFGKELASDSPWCNFLTNFAGIAGNSLDRIIKAGQFQKNQRERTEDYMVIDTAERVNFITHELINRIENLNGSAALLKRDLTRLAVDGSLKHALEGRVEEVREQFGKLRGLVEGLHRAALISEQSSPCSLEQTVRKVIGLHEAGSNIDIEFHGITARGPGEAAPRVLNDVSINLPAFVVELTFGNLIRNSITAIIKRGPKPGGNGAGAQGQIRIWAEVEEGGKFVNCFVRDTGVGVSPNIRDSIFNLSVSTTPGRGGWGLFYLRRTLERNGGSIELQHSEPGDTTFSVRLPKFSAEA